MRICDEQVSCFTTRPHDRSTSFHVTEPSLSRVNLGMNTWVLKSLHGLMAEFNFSAKQGRCNVGVYTLFTQILRITGKVRCLHRNWPPLNPPLPGIIIVDGEGDLPTEPDQDMIHLYRLSGNPLARCFGLWPTSAVQTSLSSYDNVSALHVVSRQQRRFTFGRVS